MKIIIPIGIIIDNKILNKIIIMINKIIAKRNILINLKFIQYYK